jgi:glycosyltransferase involved in cell wall biosynthesis
MYSFSARRLLGEVLDHFRPDIVHVHNVHHHLSPSILSAIRERGIPVAMTMHDYKLVCPSYCLRGPGGQVCQACGGRRFYHCLLRRCAKGSLAHSAVLTAEMYLHRALRLLRHVNVFIAPSAFMRQKMLELGLRGPVVHVPHFVDAASYVPSPIPRRRRLVYVGRLSPEKGLFTLLQAAEGLDAEVRIVGEGPQRPALEEYVRRRSLRNVVFTGWKTGTELAEEIRQAQAMLVPSEWYEVFGRTIIEAFAASRPVIGARLGAILELVRDGQTGWTFQAGEAADLRRQMQACLGDPAEAERLGIAARRVCEREFTPRRHYERILAAYRVAAERAP